MLNADSCASEMAAASTILIFDSGLGGLTVYREVVKICSDLRYVYVADDAFFSIQRSQ